LGVKLDISGHDLYEQTVIKECEDITVINADPSADVTFIQVNYSSAIAERPRDARVTSIRKIAKWSS